MYIRYSNDLEDLEALARFHLHRQTQRFYLHKRVVEYALYLGVCVYLLGTPMLAVGAVFVWVFFGMLRVHLRERSEHIIQLTHWKRQLPEASFDEQSHSLALTEAGLLEASQEAEEPALSLVELHETAGHVFLYVDMARAYVIPRGKVDEGDLEGFLQHLRKQMASEEASKKPQPPPMPRQIHWTSWLSWALLGSICLYVGLLIGSRYLAKEQLRQVAQLYNQKQYNKALQKLRMIKWYAASVKAVAEYEGLLLLRQKRPKEALPILQRLITQHPKYARGWVARGKVLFAFKRYEGALRDFQMALHLSPKAYAMYLNIGNIHWLQRRDTLAFVAYTKALKQPRLRPFAWMKRGDIYLRQREYKKAMNEYGKVITWQGPTRWRFRNYLQLAKAFAQVRDYKGALLALKKASRVNRRSIQPFVQQAQVYFAMGKLDAAQELTQQLVRQEALFQEQSGSEPFAQGYHLLGKIALAQGQLQRALKAFAKAHTRTKKQRPDWWLLRSKTEFAIGQTEAALQSLSKAERLYKLQKHLTQSPKQHKERQQLRQQMEQSLKQLHQAQHTPTPNNPPTSRPTKPIHQTQQTQVTSRPTSQATSAPTSRRAP